MALTLLNFSPLPIPPEEYSPQYGRQLIRTLELYFSQLDSNTPNFAKSDKADVFYGGELNGDFVNVTTTEKNALTATVGQVVFDTALGKLCVYSGAAWETITSV